MDMCACLCVCAFVSTSMYASVDYYIVLIDKDLLEKELYE